MKFKQLRRVLDAWEVITENDDAIFVDTTDNLGIKYSALNDKYEIEYITDPKIQQEIDEYIKQELHNKFVRWVEDRYDFEYCEAVGFFETDERLLPNKLIQDLKVMFVDRGLK